MERIEALGETLGPKSFLDSCDPTLQTRVRQILKMNDEEVSDWVLKASRLGAEITMEIAELKLNGLSVSEKMSALISGLKTPKTTIDLINSLFGKWKPTHQELKSAISELKIVQDELLKLGQEIGVKIETLNSAWNRLEKNRAAFELVRSELRSDDAAWYNRSVALSTQVQQLKFTQEIATNYLKTIEVNRATADQTLNVVIPTLLLNLEK
jgi:hypothetical protein